MGGVPSYNGLPPVVEPLDGNSTEGFLDNVAVALPLGVGLSSLSLLTFLGNALVVHAIRTERKLRTVSNMFILSLAIADLIVGLIVMPISSAYVLTGDWIFGLIVCQFWLVVDYTASTASIFNLLILSLDRYWSIRSPLKYLCKRTKKRALGMIGIVWVISASWVVPIIGWHLWGNGGVRKYPDHVCETEFSDNVFFKLTTSAANFFIPMSLMVILYYKIFREIKRRGKFDIGRCSVSGACGDGQPGKGSKKANKKREKQEKQEKGKKVTNKGSAKSIIKTSCNSSRKMGATKGVERAGDSKGKEKESGMRMGMVSSQSGCLMSSKSKGTSGREKEDKGGGGGEGEGESGGGGEGVGGEPGGLATTGPVSASGSNSLAPINEDCDCDQVKHYQQLTIVKPDKADFALEDFRDVTVQVEYISGGGGGGGGLGGVVCEAVVNQKESSASATIRCSPVDKRRQTAGEEKASAVGAERASVRKEKTKTRNNPRKWMASNLSPEKSEKSPADEPSKGSPAKIQRLSSTDSKTSRSSFGAALNEGSSDCHSNPVPSTVTSAQTITVPVTHNQHNHQHALRRVESSRLRQEKKAARQLGVILGAFILCWLPYITVFIVTAYCDCISHSVHTITIWLGYFNSTVNPFLYALCNDNFKQAFRKLLGRGSRGHIFETVAHGTSFKFSRSNFA